MEKTSRGNGLSIPRRGNSGRPWLCYDVGCFQLAGLRTLIRLETSLTGGRYVAILVDHLYPFMTCMHSNRCALFQQDSAAARMSTVTKFWLEDHSSVFGIMTWPRRSPILNAVKCISNAVQRAVNIRNPLPTNMT